MNDMPSIFSSSAFLRLALILRFDGSGIVKSWRREMVTGNGRGIKYEYKDHARPQSCPNSFNSGGSSTKFILFKERERTHPESRQTRDNHPRSRGVEAALRRGPMR